MSQEIIWKPVVGFEGEYEVSSLGGVRSARKNQCEDKNRDKKKLSKLTNKQARLEIGDSVE